MGSLDLGLDSYRYPYDHELFIPTIFLKLTDMKNEYFDKPTIIIFKIKPLEQTNSKKLNF